MKKINLILALVIISLSSIAQKDFVWEEVVKIDSASESELFSRANICVKTNFDPKNVVIDESSKSFTIRGYYPCSSLETKKHFYRGGYVHFRLFIAVKDGRYKYTLDKCFHDSFDNDHKLVEDAVQWGGVLTGQSPSMKGVMSDDYWNNTLKPEFAKQMEILISHIKLAMLKKTAKSSDW